MTTPYRPGDGLNQFVTSMPPTVHPGPPISGVGIPEGVVPANQGTAYTDTANNWLWVKFAGVAELGWKHVGLSPASSGGGGGSGIIQVFAGNGSPEGIVTPVSNAAFYTQIDSVPPGEVWDWYDGSWH